MFAELKKFSVSTDCKPVTGKPGGKLLTDEQRDKAVANGIAYFRLNRTNFSVDNRSYRTAISAVGKIDTGAPIAVLEAAKTIAVYMEMQMLASDAATYASIWAKGRSNEFWSSERREAAKQACMFFEIE